MQGGQGAMSSVMKAAANVAASAKSGLDKTKAVVEEKVAYFLPSFVCIPIIRIQIYQIIGYYF